MTLKVSTKLRNAMLGDANPTVVLMAANTISFDSASGEIRDSGSGFVTKGFVAGDSITVDGSVSNDSIFTATSVTAGAIATSEGVTDEAAGTVFALAAAQGGSLRDILQNGVIEIRSGAQPASPDDAATGTLLGTVTLSSGAFTPGAEANGLELGDAASGEIDKAADVWSFAAVATGIAGHFRFKGNATDAGGISTTLPRIDGSIGTSGADLNMPSTSIESGSTYTIDACKFTLPEYYGA